MHRSRVLRKEAFLGASRQVQYSLSIRCFRCAFSETRRSRSFLTPLMMAPYSTRCGYEPWGRCLTTAVVDAWPSFFHGDFCVSFVRYLGQSKALYALLDAVDCCLRELCTLDCLLPQGLSAQTKLRAWLCKLCGGVEVCPFSLEP